MSTSKKVVVITGASQGIGAGLVEGFRALGHQVVATSRSIKESSDPNVLTVAGDIAERTGFGRGFLGLGDPRQEGEPGKREAGGGEHGAAVQRCVGHDHG